MSNARRVEQAKKLKIIGADTMQLMTSEMHADDDTYASVRYFLIVLV